MNGPIHFSYVWVAAFLGRIIQLSALSIHQRFTFWAFARVTGSTSLMQFLMSTFGTDTASTQTLTRSATSTALDTPLSSTLASTLAATFALHIFFPPVFYSLSFKINLHDHLYEFTTEDEDPAYVAESSYQIVSTFSLFSTFLFSYSFS
jgi:hypothetical protein